MLKSALMEHGPECVIRVGTIRTLSSCADNLAILPLNQVYACMHHEIIISNTSVVMLNSLYPQQLFSAVKIVT